MENKLKSILDKIQNLENETLEEAAEIEFPLVDTEWCRTGAAEEENLHLLGHRKSFIKGAKWQAERMYNDIKLFTEELKDKIDSFEYSVNQNSYILDYIEEWFEQFKNK